MPYFHGEVYGEGPGVRVYQVGAFPGPRVHGQPVAMTTLESQGPFTLEVPEGCWHIHAVGLAAERQDALSGIAWGSHGGIYGFGRPVRTDRPEPLRVHVSPLWRDLTHVPRHQQPALSDDQWQSIYRVIGALSQDLASAVSGDLDRSASLARTRLSALFKRGVGLTMEEFRIRLRLEAAKALLVQTDRDILAIALEVGYATGAQLARMFQRYLGVSPGEFRRLAREVQAGAAPAPDRVAGHGQVRAEGLLARLVPWLSGRGATVRGEVLWSGSAREGLIYVGLFPNPVPDTYPSAWCSLPAPGPFTLRGAPPGVHYVLACYCRRRMLWPGDLASAFAYGGYGDVDTTGALAAWNPVPITLREGDAVAGITIELVEGDAITRYGRRWSQLFLPDGR